VRWSHRHRAIARAGYLGRRRGPFDGVADIDSAADEREDRLSSACVAERGASNAETDPGSI